MEKATKIKVILIASFGLFALVILTVCLMVTGSDEKKPEGSDVNTSLRAQTESDFTIDDMMKADGHPDYKEFTEEVYQQPPDTVVYSDDPEAVALQRQLRENQGRDLSDSTAVRKPPVTRKKKKAKPQPVALTEQPKASGNRFFSGDKQVNRGNTIEAIVSGDQKITGGSVLKLVTLQELSLDNGRTLGRGTALFGVVELKQDRILITIQSVRIGNSIYDLQKTVYDRDGLPGIYVPLNIKAEASKEAAEEVVNGANVTPYNDDVLSTSVNAVSNAAKSVFRKRNNQVIVTVKSNYKLYLK